MNIRSFEELNDILIDVDEVADNRAVDDEVNDDIKVEEMDYDNDDFELDESNVRNRSNVESVHENFDSDNDDTGKYNNDNVVNNEFLKRSVNFIDIRRDEDSVVTSMDFSVAKDSNIVTNSIQNNSDHNSNNENTMKWKQAKESPTKLTHTPPKVMPTIKPYLSANTHNNSPIIVGGNGPVGRYSNVKIVPKQDIPGIKVTVNNNKVIPVKALDTKTEINENLYGLIQGLVDDAAKKKNDNKKIIDKVALHAVPVKNFVHHSIQNLPNSNYLDDIYADDLTRSMTAGVTSVAKGEKLIHELSKHDKKISLGTDITNNKEKDHERQLEEALQKLGINKHELNNKSELIYAQFLSDMINLCRARAKACNTIEEMAMHRVLANHLQQSFTPNNIVNKVRNDMSNIAVETILKYKKK